MMRGRRGEGDEEDEEEDEEGEETTAELKVKVHQLQCYVRELTDHYSELMEAFEKTEGGTE